MATRKRVSIKDIADAAGVSHPTVSRALRGEGRMADATRSRIINIARELGYTPSLVARGLVTQQSYAIGLIVTNFADPFNTGLAQGLEAEARQHGYSVFLASTENDPQLEVDVARGFQGRQVDGIVVSSSRVGDKYAELLEETGVPIVLVNTHAQNDRLHAVYNDDYDGARQIVSYLIDKGYERIAFLGNQRAGRAQTERHRAWYDGMVTAGRAIDVLVFGSNGRITGGSAAIDKLLAEAESQWGVPPDAICCYNDTMAIGAMWALRQRCFKTPVDIAVTGFDDIDVAAYIDPGLTTLHQPRFELGVAAMRILLEQFKADGPQAEPITKTLSGSLIIRESA